MARVVDLLQQNCLLTRVLLSDPLELPSHWTLGSITTLPPADWTTERFCLELLGEFRQCPGLSRRSFHEVREGYRLGKCVSWSEEHTSTAFSKATMVTDKSPHSPSPPTKSLTCDVTMVAVCRCVSLCPCLRGVSSPHAPVAPDVESAVMCLPCVRDVSRSLSGSVLEMRPCHMSPCPERMRRFCDFPGSWFPGKVSRKISGLEAAHIWIWTHQQGLARRQGQWLYSEGWLEGPPALEPGPAFAAVLPSLWDWGMGRSRPAATLRRALVSLCLWNPGHPSPSVGPLLDHRLSRRPVPSLLWLVPCSVVG